MRAGHRAMVAALAVALWVSPAMAWADGGSVRYSYEQVEVGGIKDWVLVPRPALKLSGKVLQHRHCVPPDGGMPGLDVAFIVLRKNRQLSHQPDQIALQAINRLIKSTPCLDPD